MATTQPENNEHTQNGVKNGNGQSKEKSFIKVSHPDCRSIFQRILLYIVIDIITVNCLSTVT